MKKVLILGNSDQGLYKFRRELIQELLNNKFEVMISTPYGEYIPLLQKMGCIYIALEYNRAGKNPFHEIKLIREYGHILKKTKCDIALLYTIKPTLYAGVMCRIQKVPYLVNITGLGPAITTSAWLRRICFFLYKRVLKHADMVFFQNNENMKLFLEMNAVKENYKLLPGSGVNLQEYTYREYWEDEKLRILYVGRITKVKGIDELIKAIEILSQKSENFVFEFVGVCDENYKEQLNQMQQQKIIYYYGEQRNAGEYMERAQALIMPSYGEGMSNVLLEASAVGRPVLASNVSGCREIVRDGETGFLFEPHSAEEIVLALEKLQRLTVQEREQMGKMARKHVERNFSREVVVNNYMEQINRKCKE